MNEYQNQFLKLRSQVQLAHHIPGRIRLKASNELIFHLIQKKTEKLLALYSLPPALKTFQVHRSSCSAIIEYDTALLKPQLLQQLFSDDQFIALNACEQLLNEFIRSYQTEASNE